MFSMGRDRRMPLGSIWGKVNSMFRTPANAGVAVGVIAAIPFLVTDSPAVLAAGATGLIYLSYLMCNVGVLIARLRGWPHQAAWFKLGGWGLVVNVLALVWGGVMTVNFALWQDTNIFGNFGANRSFTNPQLTAVTSGGKPISWLPDLPFWEATVLLILVAGMIYYVATQLRRTDELEADKATGEAVIG
jgi:amino acid transporter